MCSCGAGLPRSVEGQFISYPGTLSLVPEQANGDTTTRYTQIHRTAVSKSPAHAADGAESVPEDGSPRLPTLPTMGSVVPSVTIELTPRDSAADECLW